jgi:hypothetical protein
MRYFHPQYGYFDVAGPFVGQQIAEGEPNPSTPGPVPQPNPTVPASLADRVELAIQQTRALQAQTQTILDRQSVVIGGIVILGLITLFRGR